MTAGRFFVYPAWQHPHIPSGTVPIVLDPGVAFGSGFHASTGDCLRVMSDGFLEDSFPGRVLDLGTGTGILAIAAAKAGAEQVLGVEMNNLSARIAGKNILLNGNSNRIRILQDTAQKHVDQTWDLVVANLTYPVLEELLPSPAFTGSPRIIVSGVRPREKGALLSRLMAQGYLCEDARERDNWCTVFLSRT